MKITSKRLVYVQPVLFKTISFYHQSEYFIEFQVKYRQSHMKNPVQAFPTVVNNDSNSSYTKKKIFRAEKSNKILTEKFLILFNDQTINFKGGCNFVIETDRIANLPEQGSTSIETFLVVSLMMHHVEKDAMNQIITNERGKIQKVGETTVFINLNVLNDYSKYSCFRHIVFTKDEYFGSLLFYIDFAHMGINLRLKDSLRLSDLSLMNPKYLDQKMKSLRNQSRKNVNGSTLRGLLGFKDLRKLYKILIADRLQQFHRIMNLFDQAITIRIRYLENYEVQEPQNFQPLDFYKSENLNAFTQILNHLEPSGFLDNEYFYEYYETDNIDEIYNCMFSESKAINQNISKVWEKLNKLKLKTLPEQFMTYALKFKIDRMTHITNFYSDVDETVYAHPQEISERIANHKIERKKVCEHSKFYDIDELKHSMLTFHSQKPENMISKTTQTNQFQILVVLVHGYQGSQRDMAKIKSFINTLTTINFLPLETLSEKGNYDLEALGKKGAQQLQKYLLKKPYIQSINFIGFSMGGIIVKSILTHLEHHKKKFNLFMTFSSPHLGICEIQNCLVSAGIYWLKTVSKSKNIKELCCEPLDKKSGEITLLKLSEQPVLSWFSHIVLIGSNQDVYVPKYSALLTYQGHNYIAQQIQKNTLKSIESLDKITAWFEYDQGCIDKLTGKKGHISFIEDNTFIEYIITKYLQFF